MSICSLQNSVFIFLLFYTSCWIGNWEKTRALPNIIVMLQRANDNIPTSSFDHYEWGKLLLIWIFDFEMKQDLSLCQLKEVNDPSCFNIYIFLSVKNKKIINRYIHLQMHIAKVIFINIFYSGKELIWLAKLVPNLHYKDVVIRPLYSLYRTYH